jgi:flagellar biosynthesis protein FlhF
VNSEPISFTGDSPEEVVAQIRSSLGPEAVVLNVRSVRPAGLARLWRRPTIEVLACRPQADAPVAEETTPPEGEGMEELRRRMSRLEEHLSRQLQERASLADRKPSAREDGSAGASPYRALRNDDAGASVTGEEVLDCEDVSAGRACRWRVGSVLQRTGLLGVHADFVVDQLRARCGESPPESLAQEIGLARGLLTQIWTRPPVSGEQPLHVLVGPPGSGKTTFLCKWLSQAALVEGRLARVWRLDGATANLAQNLSVYCEVLAVPVDRFWEERDRGAPAGAVLAEDIGLIDLPGVDWRDSVAIAQLGEQIKGFGSCQVHLVVNAAYDTAIVLAQIKAFSELPVDDLIVTHLDEEPRRGKLWNLVLGTNYTIRYLGTGQNVPGDFCAASAEAILAEQFR